MDGFKESHRKILYGTILKNIGKGKTLKVAQLSGFIAEKTHYKHGEQNLQDTIIKLAQDYVGSGNLSLLVPDGMFGSRLNNGKDAAAARYIFTTLQKHTKYIFREEDEPLLD
jgi:DNA topoisomerase-2